MYLEEGTQGFEMHLKQSGSEGCNSGTSGSTDISADLSMYYSTDGGNNYQGWKAASAFDAKCEDPDGDGDYRIYLDVEFVDDEDSDSSFVDTDESNDPALTYQSLNQDDLEHFKPNGNFIDTSSSPEFSGHSDYWVPKVYSNPDDEIIDRLVNHYFAELPEEFSLTVDNKSSNTVSEVSSSGTLTTGGSGRFVTYLHVTKNEVEVEIEA